jgi:hypothetical protein
MTRVTILRAAVAVILIQAVIAVGQLWQLCGYDFGADIAPHLPSMLDPDKSSPIGHRYLILAMMIPFFAQFALVPLGIGLAWFAKRWSVTIALSLACLALGAGGWWGALIALANYVAHYD